MPINYLNLYFQAVREEKETILILKVVLLIICYSNEFIDIGNNYFSSFGFEDSFLFKICEYADHIFSCSTYQVCKIIARHIDFDGHSLLKINFIFFTQNNQLQRHSFPDRLLGKKCNAIG